MSSIVVLVVSYVVFCAAFLFIALFGRNAIFQGTFLESAHDLLAGGWFDKLIGCCERRYPRAAAALLSAERYCCNQKNPVLPATYFLLLSTCFWLYQKHVFQLLPTPLTPTWHIYTGTASVLLCVAFWCAAALSDPGVVTPRRHAAWAARDPAGNALYPTKHCATCDHARPGRSKHCSVCRACVARHDHHCGWINNCVGAYNLRWFLGFVASNCVMMCYGAALAAAALYGHLVGQGLQNATYYDAKSGKRRHIIENKALVFKICMRSFPVPMLLAIFLSLTGLIMGCFAVYHCIGISANVTGTERHKLAELRRAFKLQGTAAQAGEDRFEFPYKQSAWKSWKEALFPGMMGLMDEHSGLNETRAPNPTKKARRKAK